MFFVTGVMTAVEVVVENLKKMSKQVSTPEEIAQVSEVHWIISWINLNYLHIWRNCFGNEVK